MSELTSNRRYAGFWVRTAAAMVDSFLFLVILAPLLTLIYGTNYWPQLLTQQTPKASFLDALLNYILPAIAVIVFWVYKSATPGKILLKLSIIDATTGGKPSTGQLIGRYLGYYVSILPLMLGIFWVGIDAKKQGWHDKLSGTVVIHDSTSQRPS